MIRSHTVIAIAVFLVLGQPVMRLGYFWPLSRMVVLLLGLATCLGSLCVVYRDLAQGPVEETDMY